MWRRNQTISRNLRTFIKNSKSVPTHTQKIMSVLHIAGLASLPTNQLTSEKDVQKKITYFGVPYLPSKGNIEGVS